MSAQDDQTSRRKAWMGLLAKTPAADLAERWQTYAKAPHHSLLRAPEIGSVMVRGRMGAVGSQFNMGEITITRCSVRLATGEDGHAYVKGRSRSKALQAALIDALMHTPEAKEVQDTILTPLDARLKAAKTARAEKAAATKVDFFTMARGED